MNTFVFRGGFCFRSGLASPNEWSSARARSPERQSARRSVCWSSFHARLRPNFNKEDHKEILSDIRHFAPLSRKGLFIIARASPNSASQISTICSYSHTLTSKSPNPRNAKNASSSNAVESISRTSLTTRQDCAGISATFPILRLFAICNSGWPRNFAATSVDLDRRLRIKPGRYSPLADSAHLEVLVLDLERASFKSALLAPRTKS